jgi:hypothetical protein
MTIRKVKKKVETDEQWTKRRASQARSSWLRRAKKLAIDTKNIPSKEEIMSILIHPLICYLSLSQIPKDVVELDHKNPVSRGGSFDISNIGITSRYYNQIKGDLTEKEFRSLLKIVSKWEDKGKSLFSRLLSSGNRFKKK